MQATPSHGKRDRVQDSFRGWSKVLRPSLQLGQARDIYSCVCTTTGHRHETNLLRTEKAQLVALPQYKTGCMADNEGDTDLDM